MLGKSNGKDFTDANGTHFKGFPRAIGVLNCRHFAFSVILDASAPNYTQKELDEILAKNEKGYTFPSGRRLTIYECTQEQRRLETAIRHAKDGAIAARAAGDSALEGKYRAKAAKYTNQYKAFSSACGLSPKFEKTAVKGYGNKKAVDNSGKSDIIKENDKKSITQITDQHIEQIPNVKIQSYSDEQNSFIQQQHKDLLRYAQSNNESKEVAFVFDNSLKNRKEYIGSDDMLDFGSLLNGKDLFVMHNHPRNSSYSDRDIRFLLGNDNIKTLSIVKNNGRVEILSKTSNFDKPKAIIDLKRAVKKHIKKGTDEEINKAIESFLKNNGGLEWIKI